MDLKCHSVQLPSPLPDFALALLNYSLDFPRLPFPNQLSQTPYFSGW